MHQFVESAIEAAKQGDNEKAVNFLKQVLSENQNDVDAWLVLAAVVDDPQTKRKCLTRVLKLDPVNVVAREELAEMDRAESGYASLDFDPAQGSGLEVDSVSTTSYEPGLSSSFSRTSLIEPDLVEEPIPPVPKQVESSEEASGDKQKKLVFGFPMVWRVIIYFLVLLFGCAGLFIATRSFLFSLPFIGLAFLMLAAAFSVSSSVELSGQGIRVSGLFSNQQTGWGEIVSAKNNPLLFRLELVKGDNEMVNISTLVNGYSRILKILKKQRPDLFDTESTQPQI